MSDEKNADKNIASRLEQIEKKLGNLVSQCETSGSSVVSMQSAMRSDDEIDLRDLWSVIWKGRWTIVATTFMFAIASTLYALSLPNTYKSEALLAPVEENSGGGIAGLAGQLGGFASLAGVNFGGGTGDKTTLAIEVLKSRAFISKFIQKYDLHVPLMAAKKWSSSADKLVYDSNIYDETTKRWVREVKSLKSSEPSSQKSYKRFMGLLSVSQDKITNYVSVSIEFYSPNIAKLWVERLTQEINQEIKAREVAEAKRSIEYLRGQLEKTALADMKAVFYQLIEEQMKTVMFAEVRDEYVFKTIDPAVVPELKTRPKRALIVILGTIIGGILSVIAVMWQFFIKV